MPYCILMYCSSPILADFLVEYHSDVMHHRMCNTVNSCTDTCSSPTQVMVRQHRHQVGRICMQYHVPAHLSSYVLSLNLKSSTYIPDLCCQTWDAWLDINSISQLPLIQTLWFLHCCTTTDYLYLDMYLSECIKYFVYWVHQTLTNNVFHTVL